MTRETYIEQIRRLIYGGQPDDDAEITIGLVNVVLDQAIAVAAKTNYKDALAIDGITYVNNSFYTTFRALEVEVSDQFLWRITLPQIPIGIGTTNGISNLILKDFETRKLSFPIVWLTQNQLTYYRGMRVIPNKILGYSEGEFVYLISTIGLSAYTAQVTMVSGGNSSDLQSTLNVPADYLPVVTEYLKTYFMFERSVPKDLTPDGQDFIKET